MAPLLFTILTLFSTHTNAAPVEAWYQDVWCEGMGGVLEYRLESGRRIDCLTDTHAIEIEFAQKWPEAIGQSLSYAMQTERKAGIVLILKSPQDLKHWQRLNAVVETFSLPIEVWRLGP